MKKLIHFIALMVVTSVFVKAQHVVTNAADEFTQPSFSLNWTLGEPVCETYPVGTNFLTQGFQQPGYEGMVYSLQTDSLALVALYNATDGPNWINNSNWLITPVENWFGITITDGRVTGIKIKFNNLLGVLPSDIGNLSMLTYLNFRGNQLSGSIPPQLWNLQNLWTLDLGQNNFSGSIPHLIGNLNELRYLYLIANQFTGTITDPLWGLTNLELIQISGNFLEGEISENIGNLPNLWLFDIAGNNFSGTLPEELYSMTQLTCLSVGWNDFTGPLDMKLCTQLINLNYLSIEYCYFGQESCDVVNCLINRGGWEWFEHSPQNNGFTFPNDCSCEDALADAGENIAVCDETSVELNGSAVNATSIMWATEGDGMFDDATLLNATYTLGPMDMDNGYAILCLEAYASPPCLDNEDCMEITFQKSPTNYVGPDATICEGEVYTFDMAWAENYSYIQWYILNGLGDFDNESILHPTYYPSPIDYLQGMITIGMWAEPINPCVTAAEDFMELYFSAPPEVYLGNDFLICSDETVYLDDIIIENYASYQWDIQGDGELLADDNFDNVSYTPGSGDIQNGFAQLCLTAIANEGCENATDCISINIQPPPTNYVGPDATICGEESYTFDEAWAENYFYIQWFTINGAGFFNDETLLHPTYYISPVIDPSIQPIMIGMMAMAVNPCIVDAVDTMNLYLTMPPEVNLGADLSMCGDETVYLNEIAIEFYASYQWDIQGDGELLADDNFENVSYTPGPGDIENGFAQLCLTAYAWEPYENITDCIDLYIQRTPTIYAGRDATIWHGETYTFDEAWAEDYQAIYWNCTNCGGYFDNYTQLNPTYTPSPLVDYFQGMINIVMIAEPINPCTFVVEDYMNLYFVGQAIEVPGGWSGISSYIQAPDGNIDNLFEPYLDKLEVLSNFSGIFYPGQNINTLGIFNYQSGYQIKASEPFALTFSGFSHEGANLTKGAGWSIIPVLTSCMVDIEELFQNNQSLVIVKEVAGPGVYWPEYQINTLHHLKPGKAYYTLQNATETIDFPDCENQWLCGQPLVECRDGQFYKTVQIGGQCWMAENLNTGLRIDVALNQTNNQLTEKYCYNDDEQNCNTYGALYQWEELMKYSEDESTQGICPPTGGWHIPSTGEWKILEGNADSQFNPGDPEWDRFGFRGIDACGNLKEEGFDHWLEPNMGATNLVGFRAFASGSRSYDGSEFKRIGKDGLFWSSSFDPNFAVAITHRMYYDRQTSHREYLVPSIGLSVRCIKDEENPNFPPVKPHTPNPDNGAEIQSTSLTLSWQCSDPESEGLSYSIYFGDAEYPPLAESNLSENSYLVTGLDMNTTYYWRIVAKDPQNNTSESFVWHFSTTDAWQCGQLLFDEHDGQSYQTVPIGDKCWMAENLNIGTMVSNSSIQTNNQIIEKYCYDEDTQNCETYGGLYSWDEMMKYSNLEGGQGICPPTGGWHVATDDEWKNLEGSVDSQYGVGDPEWDQFAIPRGFDAGGNLKETGFDHWLEPNTGATNSSGFSGLPGSYGIGIIWGELGESAYFWTSSKYEDDTNWSRSMSHLNSRIGRDPIMQSSIGLSVRCVKDAIPVKVSNNKF